MSMVYRKNVERSAKFLAVFIYHKNIYSSNNEISAINWTNDESVYGILVNSEVQFYEKDKPGNFF